MKKTVTEWLGEIKLYDKKISKTELKLDSMEMFNISTIGEASLYKETLEKNKEEVKALYESYLSMVKNRNKIRAKILSFNATETIKIGNEEYIIALALEKMKETKDNLEKIIEKQISTFNSKVNTIKQNVEYKKENLLESISKKANTSANKDMEAVEKAVEQYQLYQDDFLELQKTLDKIKEDKIIFMENVNIQLNLKNATSELEIDL